MKLRKQERKLPHRKDLFLHAGDYSFTALPDGQFGDSVYLAEAKGDGEPSRLIVYDSSPYAVCNEMMFYRMAECMRFPAPKAYLFRSCDTDESLFLMPYTVGVSFPKGVRNLTEDYLNNSYRMRKELSMQIAMNAFCIQKDKIPIGILPDGHVVSYDHTHSFCLDEFGALLTGQSEGERVLALVRCMNRFQDRICLSTIDGTKTLYETLTRFPLDGVHSMYRSALDKTHRLREQLFADLFDVFDEIYPPEISAYFRFVVYYLHHYYAVTL